MSAPPELDLSAELNCPRCALAVPRGFAFCPRCRAQGEGREYDPHELDRHERQYVISLVVLSLGVLAVPRLLRSHAFSPAGKAFFALLGFLNTAGVVVICYGFFGVWFPDYVSGLLQQAGR